MEEHAAYIFRDKDGGILNKAKFVRNRSAQFRMKTVA
jgi:hypothetical protein